MYEEVTEAPGTKNIRFEVMACNDAHILLHKVDDDVQNNLYELVIGRSLHYVDMPY